MSRVEPAWGGRAGLDRLRSVSLAVLVLVSTLGEGGGSPQSLLAVHTVLVLALVAALVSRPVEAVDQGALPGGSAALFSLFVAAVGLGAVASPYAYAALLAWIELLAFGAAAWLAARSGPGLLEALALPVLAGGASQAVIAAGQALGGEPRPAGTFLNPSHLGAWLVATVLLVAPTVVKAPASVAALRVSLAALALYGVYLTRSRGAILGLVAGGAFLLWRIWRDLERRARVVALGAAAAILLIVGAGLVARIRERDPFQYHRIGIWKASLALALDRPWTGAGPGQFAAAAAALKFPIEEGPLRFERYFTNTHSDLLRLPCELGWPAALLALAAVLWVARETRERLRGAPPAAVGAAAALVALAAQALVENLTDRPAVYLLAAVLLGGLLSVPARPAPPAPRLSRWAMAALLVAAYVVGDLAPYRSWFLAHGLPRGRPDPASRARLGRALDLNPLDAGLWMRRAEDLAGDGSEWTPAVYAAVREVADHAVRMQPADAAYRVRRGRLEALACFTLFRDEATRARADALYGEAEALSPKDALIPLEKGWFLLEAADPAGARRAAERALRLEPESVTPRLLLAKTLLALGGPGAVEAAERALSEAVAKARRWAPEPRLSPYARRLLDLDAGKVGELRRRIGDARAVDERGTLGTGHSAFTR